MRARKQPPVHEACPFLAALALTVPLVPLAGCTPWAQGPERSVAQPSVDLDRPEVEDSLQAEEDVSANVADDDVAALDPLMVFPNVPPLPEGELVLARADALQMECSNAGGLHLVLEVVDPTGDIKLVHHGGHGYYGLRKPYGVLDTRDLRLDTLPSTWFVVAVADLTSLKPEAPTLAPDSPAIRRDGWCLTLPRVDAISSWIAPVANEALGREVIAALEAGEPLERELVR